MKKTIVMMTMILTAAVTGAYAGNGKDWNERAAASFSKDFSNAKNVSWQHRKDYAKATFNLNNDVMYAYYNNDNGELIAVSRNILSDRLPISLMADVKRSYSDYWISDLFEIASQDQTSYYVTLENADETLVLKSNGSSDWSLYKRTKKQS